MAEGGIAAALGSMDSRDNWKVHFEDTMFGGKYLNNWRMAEIHAKEAPERVQEPRALGRRVRPQRATAASCSASSAATRINGSSKSATAPASS